MRERVELFYTKCWSFLYICWVKGRQEGIYGANDAKTLEIYSNSRRENLELEYQYYFNPDNSRIFTSMAVQSSRPCP